MLIDLERLNNQYGLQVEGVLHVGAHWGEEIDVYNKLGYKPVYWIEADASSIDQLKTNVEKYTSNFVIQAACSNEVGPVLFHHANNGQSSSILELGSHKEEHPDVVYTSEMTLMATTVDTLLDYGFIRQCNFMNLDVQGAELMVLKGSCEYLKKVDYVYSEINIKELYIGCPLLTELDQWLRGFGFILKEKTLTVHGWGDGFWSKEK